MKSTPTTRATLAVTAALFAIISTTAAATTINSPSNLSNPPRLPVQPIPDSHHHTFQRRDEDAFNIFIRKRNAHACMMSIAFIVLFPIGALTLHLPLKGHKIIPYVHAPIQIIGLLMVIGAMGLGIDIAQNDLMYFNTVVAHIVIGLLACGMLILFQPALGIAQHIIYKRTGKRTIWAHLHRWNGRVFIVLGWINSGLGFQLTMWMGLPVTTSCYVREYVLLGLLGGAWITLVGVDGLRSYFLKKEKLGSKSVEWNRVVPFVGRRSIGRGGKGNAMGKEQNESEMGMEETRAANGDPEQ